MTDSATRRRWLALGVLCLSLLVVSIDAGILNVALPTLVHELGATPAELQWIIDAYTLVFAGLLLSAGSLGDRYGRRRVMSVGLGVLGTASCLATFSTSPLQLVGCRALLGVGSALIMPATLSILFDVFTDAAERRRAIVYWSLMNAVGGFLGPVTGGLLLRWFSWSSTFFVNVPIVAVALVLARRLVPESYGTDATSFDIGGAITSTGALALLLWTIIEGPSRGWSEPTIALPLIGAAVFFALFVWWERRVDEPMIELSMFRIPQLSGAALAMTVAFLAMTGAMFLSVQSLQLVRGYTPLVAALATSGPIVSVNFLLMPRTPRLVERFGVRALITAGCAAIAAASLIISRTTADSRYLTMFVGFALMAVGFSLFVPSSTEAIMTAVPPRQSGGASAINQLTRQVGQALGVATIGSIAASRYRSSFRLPSDDSIPRSSVRAASASITGAIDTARQLPRAGAAVVLASAQHAFASGLRRALLVSACIAVVAGVCAALRLAPHQGGGHRGRATGAELDTGADTELVEATLEAAR